MQARLVSRAPLAALLVVALLASACTVSKNPVSGNKRAYGYSWEQERQLGAEADKQIMAQYGLVQDEQLRQYVERVGQQVLQESHLRRPDTDKQFRNTPVEFRVLDSPVVNAFALPGGYVYVTRGLLAHLNNEAQLAVVLGHEIGHVAARHASQRAFEQQLGQIGLIGGAILGQEVLGLPGQDILNLGSQAAQLLFLSYGREDERESDQLGVEYAALAGYEAAEGSAFFRSLKRLGQQQGGGLPSWLSTHPDPGEREQRIVELAQRWRGEAQMTQVDQQQYYNAIEGIVLGENPRNGFTRNGTFYHPELRFQFPVPQGYQVINQAQQVALIRGSGQNMEAAIVFTLSESNSVDQAVRQFASQQGLQVVNQGQARSGGNIPAQYVIVDAQTQQGQTVRAIAYFLSYRGQVYSFVGYAPQQTFNRYKEEFDRVMQGFSELTDRQILNVEPARLVINPTQRSAPFSAFVPEGELPPDMTAQDLAILNQVELNETIQAGRPLKLPRQ